MLRILNCIFLSVLVVISYWALHIGAAAYQDAEFAEAVGRVPTWIGAFFGTITAVCGAYLISLTKQEKEIKDFKYNISRILIYESLFYIGFVKGTLDEKDKILITLSKEDNISMYEASKMINFHNNFLISDIPEIFRKDIIHFNNDEIEKILLFFSTIKTCNAIFMNEKTQNIAKAIVKINEYFNVLEKLVEQQELMMKILSRYYKKTK